jgi:hypothetical protein
MTAWLDRTAQRTAPAAGRRWPLWAAGAALGLGVAMLSTGDSAASIADFLVTRVIEPFSQIALQGFLCL